MTDFLAMQNGVIVVHIDWYLRLYCSEWPEELPLVPDWLILSIKDPSTHLIIQIIAKDFLWQSDPHQGFDSGEVRKPLGHLVSIFTDDNDYTLIFYNELLKALFTDSHVVSYVSGSIWLVCVHGTILIALGKISNHLHHNVVKVFNFLYLE